PYRTHDASRLCSASFFFSSRRRHTRFSRDWSSDVCSSDLLEADRHITMASANLRVLKYINPSNSSEIARAYITREKTPRNNPRYRYRDLQLDPQHTNVEPLNLPIVHSERGRIYRAQRHEVSNTI